MFGRQTSFLHKTGYWLVIIFAMILLIGCTPKLVPSLSPEDLQTCDDTVASKAGWIYDDSYPNGQPYQVRPGQVEITSPLHGSILPYGESVFIHFKQPTANEGVLYRNYRVLVTSLTGSDLDWIGDQYAVVTQPPNEFEVTWTPPKSGKYIIYVLIRNMETIPALGGNTTVMGEELEKKMYMAEDFDIHTGPFSMAYSCIKIDNPSAALGKTNQPGTLLPLQNITNLVPTITWTVTMTPTKPTLIPTFTFTPLIPTITLTMTPRPFRPTFTKTVTPKPPTPVPPTETPTEVVSCSDYTDADHCNMNSECEWYTPPTGGPGECRAK